MIKELARSEDLTGCNGEVARQQAYITVAKSVKLCRQSAEDCTVLVCLMKIWIVRGQAWGVFHRKRVWACFKVVVFFFIIPFFFCTVLTLFCKQSHPCIVNFPTPRTTVFAVFILRKKKNGTLLAAIDVWQHLVVDIFFWPLLCVRYAGFSRSDSLYRPVFFLCVCAFVPYFLSRTLLPLLRRSPRKKKKKNLEVYIERPPICLVREQ